MKKVNHLTEIAYHEAAHFVTTIIGHDQPGGQAAYSTPDSISIIPSKNSLGRVVDRAYSSTLFLRETDLVKDAISLLSGYVAQSIIGKEPIHWIGFEFKLERTGPQNDITKVRQLLEQLVSRTASSSTVAEHFHVLLNHTHKVILEPTIWSAITLIAQRLLIDKEIDRTNGLYELIEEIQGIPGFDCTLIKIPSDLLQPIN